jgi:hypothetical protein
LLIYDVGGVAPGGGGLHGTAQGRDAMQPAASSMRHHFFHLPSLPLHTLRTLLQVCGQPQSEPRSTASPALSTPPPRLPCRC